MEREHHPGFPAPIRDFRQFLLENHIDLELLEWLNDYPFIKTLYLKSWEKPHDSQLCAFLGVSIDGRYSDEKQRTILIGATVEHLTFLRPQVEIARQIDNTRAGLLLFELAVESMSGWGNNSLEWHTRPSSLWPHPQERSVALKKLESLGLVQCTRQARKTTHVLLNERATTVVVIILQPLTAGLTKKTIMKFYDNLKIKYLASE